MKLDIYVKDGWVDIEKILSFADQYPFIYVWGGRGIGKTYSALKYLANTGEPFIYMRRTQKQTDMINKREFSPFGKINVDTGSTIQPYNIGDGIAAYYHTDIDGDKVEPVGDPIGFSLSLSTISDIRGFDASTVKTLFYDEFIPEPHKRWMKLEHKAVLNAYETVNRNRELDGLPPLHMLCCSNSDEISNPIFVGLNLVDVAAMMQRKGIVAYAIPERRTLLINCKDSPISARKKDTALYQMAAGTDYGEMALDNHFEIEDEAMIQPRPLREYVPIMRVGNVCIYQHKTGADLYACAHAAGNFRLSFGVSDADLRRFRRAAYYIDQARLSNTIYYDTAMTQSLLSMYLKG